MCQNSKLARDPMHLFFKTVVISQNIYYAKYAVPFDFYE